METQILREELNDLERNAIETVGDFQKKVKTTLEDFKSAHESYDSYYHDFQIKVEEGFIEHTDQIYENKETALETKATSDQLIKNQNKNQEELDEMSRNLEELLTWKHEMTQKQVENSELGEIKMEEIKMETTHEIEDTYDSEEELDQEDNTSETTENENNKLEWYEFSNKFIQEEFRPNHVHSKQRNKKKLGIGLTNANK